MGIPFVAFTLYAAMTQIPTEVLEAASIDGAGPWPRFRDVVWPAIKPIFVVLVALSTLWDLRVFTQIYVLQEAGGVTSETNLLGTWAYREATTGNHFGRGAAIALVMVAINSLTMLLLYGLLGGFLLGVGKLPVPWEALVLSIAVYVALPLIAGYVSRQWLIRAKGQSWFQEHFLPVLTPITITALLITLVLLFSFKGEVILANPLAGAAAPASIGYGAGTGVLGVTPANPFGFVANPFGSVGTVTNNDGPNQVPDIVGNIRYDSPAFSAQVMGVLHQITADYYSTLAAPPQAFGSAFAAVPGAFASPACGAA